MKNRKMTIEIVNVSPEKAKEYLKKNIGNRELKPWIVKRYAELMRTGRWIAAAQPIMFDSRGHLIDGQHRLQAVINCGDAVDLSVARNVDPKAAHVCDQGSSRTVSDILTIKTGGKGIANQKIMAAIGSWMIKGFNTDPSKMPTPDQVSEFILENESILQDVNRVLQHSDYQRSYISAVFANVICHEPSKRAKVLQWCQVLKDNFGFTSTKDPLNSFHKKFKKLERERERNKVVPNRRYYAATVSAVLAKMSNKEVSVIKEASYCPFTNTRFTPSGEED